MACYSSDDTKNYFNGLVSLKPALYSSKSRFRNFLLLKRYFFCNLLGNRRKFVNFPLFTKEIVVVKPAMAIEVIIILWCYQPVNKNLVLRD